MASAGAAFATTDQGGLEPASTMARTMKLVTPSSTMHIIRVKRKRTSETSNGDPVSYHPALKRLKFVGSLSRGDEETIKGLVLASSTSTNTAKGAGPSVATANIADVAVPTLAQFDEDLTITDFEDFVFSEKVVKSFPSKDEVITCNGIPLIPAPSHVGLEEEDDDEDESGKYIYDVYLYDAKANNGEHDALREESLLVSQPPGKRHDRNHPLPLSHRQRDHLEEDMGKCDDDYSSNDEDHPDNDYPDEEDYDYNEYDYYREWEDDETREMMRAFEANCLHPDSEDEDKKGRRRGEEESDDDDLEWAGKEF